MSYPGKFQMDAYMPLFNDVEDLLGPRGTTRDGARATPLAITTRSGDGHFERHHLMFVYEEEIADRAYAVWQARGGGHGHDRGDWFEAERQLVAAGSRPMNRYRLTCAPVSE